MHVYITKKIWQRFLHLEHLINYTRLHTAVEVKGLVLPKATFEHSCSTAANSRRKSVSGKGISWNKGKAEGGVSDIWFPVSNFHDSLHAPSSKWTKMAFNFHEQPACKHNEKHFISWCSENINAWCFPFWFFLSFIIYMISVFKFLF